MSSSNRRDGNFERHLPHRPSLEHLRRQAKRLLRAARRGDTLAWERLEDSQRGLGRESVKLADAQRAIAREHGFASWRRLLAAVRAAADRELQAKMDEVRFLARRYAQSLGCSARAVRALGRSQTPTALIDELQPLCHRDVVRALVEFPQPRPRLDRLAEALQEMIDGQWDLDGASAERNPIDLATAPAHLVVVFEREPARLVGQRFAVGTGQTVVGRATRSDVCLPRESVSRRHCVIESTDAGFELRDEGSTNGVFLNEDPQRIEHSLLRHGDRIRIGSITLEFQRAERGVTVRSTSPPPATPGASSCRIPNDNGRAQARSAASDSDRRSAPPD